MNEFHVDCKRNVVNASDYVKKMGEQRENMRSKGDTQKRKRWCRCAVSVTDPDPRDIYRGPPGVRRIGVTTYVCIGLHRARLGHADRLTLLPPFTSRES